jgi:hypothetical protein
MRKLSKIDNKLTRPKVAKPQLALKKSLPVVVPAFALICLYNINTQVFLLIPPLFPLGYGINTIVNDIGMWVLGVGYIGASGCSSYSCLLASNWYLDFLVLGMLILLFWGVFRISSLLRAAQVTSFMTMLLPIEYYVTLGPNFDGPVANFQTYFRIITWFTVGDLGLVAFAIFVSTTVTMLWKGEYLRSRR